MTDTATNESSPFDLGEQAAPILEECRPIGEAFAGAGRRLYLVGGSVRDLIAGRAIDEPDFDFTTDARPAETKALLQPLAEALWTQGERFGTIAAHIGGRLVEITTHRAEAYEPDSRKPKVAFSDDIRVDLGRRDFTINALAIEVTTPSPALIDPFGGVADLQVRRLVTPLSAEESFSDDPLRMMRAARFIARFSLTPAGELVAAVESMAPRLEVVSAERVRDEFEKLLRVNDPVPGFEFLVNSGLAAQFLPELNSAVIDRVRWVELGPDPIRRSAALFAAVDGADIASRLRALRSSRQVVASIVSIASAVRDIEQHQGEWSDAQVRRFAHRRAEVIPDAQAVAAAIGRSDHALALSRAVQRVGQTEDLADMSLPVGGRDVMEVLGADAGPVIGEAMSALVQMRLDRGPLTRDQALELVTDWNARR